MFSASPNNDPHRRAKSMSRNRNTVDWHIGQSVLARRQKLAFSQQQIAETLSTTVRHVERMELGEMRYSAENLHALSRLFNVAPGFFFERLFLPSS